MPIFTAVVPFYQTYTFTTTKGIARTNNLEFPWKLINPTFKLKSLTLKSLGIVGVLSGLVENGSFEQPGTYDLVVVSDGWLIRITPYYTPID